MNRNDFNRFIADGIVPGDTDIAGIRELTDLFPWFHSAHMVLLRSLKESYDVRFDAQLKNSALYVADREVLYHYLFLQPALQIEEVIITPVAESETTAELPPEKMTQNVIIEETQARSRDELIAEVESRLHEIEMPAAEPEPLIEEVKNAEEVKDELIETPEEETIFEIDLDPNYTRGHRSDEPDEEEDLLELAAFEETAVTPEPVLQLSSEDLIERFIREQPRIERMTPSEQGPVRDLAEESSDEKGSFITETLARIYLNQGYYSKAINIYEKLTLKFPEKSAYFASRIEKIKELIK